MEIKRYSDVKKEIFIEKLKNNQKLFQLFNFYKYDAKDSSNLKMTQFFKRLIG